MTTRLIFAAFALAFGFNYSQAADIVLSIQSQADQTKAISWNSEPGALYRIESAESFSPQPQNFPNRWTVREVELPSQGASTAWMDVGDAGWIPRLFHPRLNTQRFYQVIKVGEATFAAPTVTVEVLQNGTVVPPGTAIRGDLEIRWTVGLGASGDLLSDVLVFVDGQVMTRGATLIGSRFINTTEWPNGEHRIWASAKTFQSADTTSDDGNQSVSSGVGVGVSSVTTVTFDNYISKFCVVTPYFDPAVQDVHEIVPEFKENYFWQCFVVTGSGSPVVGYQGQGTSLYVVWDGTDGAGNEFPMGSMTT